MSKLCLNCRKSHKESGSFCKPCQPVMESQKLRNQARLEARRTAHEYNANGSVRI